MQVPDDLAQTYRESVERVTNALSALIAEHRASENPTLIAEFEASMVAFAAQSDRLGGYLQELERDPEAASEAGNALGFAALVDGLIGIRCLLIVDDGESYLQPFTGLTSARFRRRVPADVDRRILNDLDHIRSAGVSSDLIDAALTGQAPPSMPETGYLSPRPTTAPPAPAGNVFTVAFNLRCIPAAELWVDVTKDLTLDLLVGHALKAIAVFDADPQPLFDALLDIDIHDVRPRLRRGACVCLTLLTRKLGGRMADTVDKVGALLDRLQTKAVDAVSDLFGVLLNSRTRAVHRLVACKAHSRVPDAAAVNDVARRKDQTKWDVTSGLAEHVFPLVAAGSNLFGLGGVPILIILVVALTVVEGALLERTLTAVLAMP